MQSCAIATSSLHLIVSVLSPRLIHLKYALSCTSLYGHHNIIRAADFSKEISKLIHLKRIVSPMGIVIHNIKMMSKFLVVYFIHLNRVCNMVAHYLTLST
jgi:hypothetical protein